jgi:alpha-tubulin suppressor-like RCC1 family protein
VNIKSSAGVAVQYYGSIGLAPGWKTAGLGLQDQKQVSACLGARTNAAGEHVMLSLRGMGLSVSTTEKARFGRHEGGFYGNLFSSTPYMKTCSVDGGGMAGRVCADGQCGFELDGDCAVVCDAVDADKNVSDCGPTGELEVMNTFLPFQRLATSGADGACFIRPTGQAWCWGTNAQGELGDGTFGTTAYRETHAAPALTPAGVRVDQVFYGSYNGMARLVNGSLYAWGLGTYGALGNGSTASNAIPQKVNIGSPVTDAAMSEQGAACAVKADGSLTCWGRNHKGQLGDGTTVSRLTPVAVPVGTEVVSVQLGDLTTCVLKGDGRVWCWGDNSQGTLGDGGTTMSLTPKLVPNLDSVVTLSAGMEHVCALKADRTVWCWGDNSEKQVGNGATADQRSPAQVKLTSTTYLTSVRSLSAGYYQSCAVKTDNTVWCWGSNEYGQFGNGSTGYVGFATQLTTLGNRVKEVRAGYAVISAVMQDGTNMSAGDDGYGAIGDGILSAPVSQKSFVRTTVTFTADDGICDFGESSTKEASDCIRPEECQGGGDEDGDGAVDCADPDCSLLVACGGSGPAADSVAPSAPVAPSLTASSAQKLTLTWAAANDNLGVREYRIERCVGATCSSFEQLSKTPASWRSFASSNLSPSTTYRFRIRAADAAGNLGPYTTVSTATTPADTTAPTAPVAPVAVVASKSQLDLSWVAATDAIGVTGYEIERCQGAGCASFAAIGTPLTPSFTSAGLAASTSYTYRVRARDAAGNPSAYSTLVSATTAAANQVIYLGPAGDYIPDAATAGITKTVTATETRTLSALNVKVKILHPCSGDLKVYLIHGATTATIYKGSGCVQVPELNLNRAEFNGQLFGGDWKLKAVDSSSGDDGTIVSWSIMGTLNL